jgi:hypothetical protein
MAGGNFEFSRAISRPDLRPDVDRMRDITRSMRGSRTRVVAASNPSVPWDELRAQMSAQGVVRGMPTGFGGDEAYGFQAYRAWRHHQVNTAMTTWGGKPVDTIPGDHVRGSTPRRRMADEPSGARRSAPAARRKMDAPRSGAMGFFSPARFRQPGAAREDRIGVHGVRRSATGRNRFKLFSSWGRANVGESTMMNNAGFYMRSARYTMNNPTARLRLTAPGMIALTLADSSEKRFQARMSQYQELGGMPDANSADGQKVYGQGYNMVGAVGSAFRSLSGALGGTAAKAVFGLGEIQFGNPLMPAGMRRMVGKTLDEARATWFNTFERWMAGGSLRAASGHTAVIRELGDGNFIEGMLRKEADKRWTTTRANMISIQREAAESLVGTVSSIDGAEILRSIEQSTHRAFTGALREISPRGNVALDRMIEHQRLRGARE